MMLDMFEAGAKRANGICRIFHLKFIVVSCKSFAVVKNILAGGLCVEHMF